MTEIDLLSGMARAFVGEPDFDLRIRALLRISGEFAGATAAYAVFNAGSKAIEIQEWPEETTPPGDKHARESLLSQSRRWEEVFTQGDLVTVDGNSRGSVPAALALRDGFSAIVLALVVEGRREGFTAFERPDAPESWTASVADVLRTSSLLIANAFETRAVRARLDSVKSNYESFFNTVDEMMIIASGNGTIIHANDAVFRKLGYPPAELYAMNVAGLHPEALRDEATAIFESMVAGERDSCPLEFAACDGTIVPVETRAWRGVWNGEECVFGISKDIGGERFPDSVPLLSRRIIGSVPVNPVFRDFLGASAATGKLFSGLERFMDRDINVLLRGESGTGKDLLAKAIHDGSGRKNGPFVIVNCSAISGELAESLLFGHKKGSFTGAIADSRGYFEQADGGTLFLDEIGDMPFAIQAKILRVIEDKSVRPVGGATSKKIDFRLITATNKDIEKEIGNGGFRQDLYYRIGEYPVFVPPLRERTGDVPILCEAFLGRFLDLFELGERRFAPDVLDSLVAYGWPGNVRELKSVVERLVLMSGGTVIGKEDILMIDSFARAEARRDEATAAEGSGSMADLERATIVRMWDAKGRNLDRTAEALKIGRTTVYRKLKGYGLI